MVKTYKICTECGKKFEVYISRLKTSPAKYCSKKCQGLSLGKKQVGKNNHMWKGDDVGINGIHEWLKNNYGKADRCENYFCEKKSNDYEWSKLEGKNYVRRRYNFWRLCTICHKKYDKIYKNIPSNFGKKYSVKHKKSISKALTGRKLSEETKRKISKSRTNIAPWNKKND